MSRRCTVLLSLFVGLVALSGCGMGVPVSGPVIWISDLSLPPHGTGEVLIRFREIPGGLQGIEVSARSGHYLTYDPTVIRVLAVEAIQPFTLDAVAVDNEEGLISFVARTPATGPFPTEGTILKLHIQHVSGTRSLLELDVTNLANGEGQPIVGATVLGGVVRVGKTVEF
jgi:hypothetical protein